MMCKLLNRQRLLDLKKAICTEFHFFAGLIRPNTTLEKIVFITTFILCIITYYSYISYIDKSTMFQNMGWDTYLYVKYAISPSFWNFRHPLFALLYSPLTIFCYVVNKLFTLFDVRWYLYYLPMAYMIASSNVMVLKLQHIYKVNDLTSLFTLVLWMSFSFYLLLILQIETFTLAMFTLLLSLLYLHQSRQTVIGDNLLFAITAGTTMTNGAKLFLGYFMVTPKNIISRCVKSSGFFVSLFIVVFCFCNLVTAVFKHRVTIVGDTFDFVFADSIFDRLKFFWINFVNEPILFHPGENVIFSNIDPAFTRLFKNSYESVLDDIIVVFIIAFFIYSLYICRKLLIVRLFALYLLVDVLIHFIIGLCPHESQLFSPNWFFFIPVIIGAGLNNIGKTARRTLIAALSCVIVYNLFYNIEVITNSLFKLI